MTFSKVEICGVNTSKLPVLYKKEKEELFEKIKQGDKEARNKFIYGNLRLVLSVIQRFSNRGEQMDDLFQVGCIGLIKAVDNFRMDKEVKFSTYAVPMILGEIRRFIRDNNAVRVPRSLRDLAYKALQCREKISNLEGREATIDEIASQLNVNREEVINALDAIVDPISLYEPVYSESGDPVYVLDQIKDNVNTVDKWIADIAMGQAISELDERERRILQLRFFKGKTQTEVASEIGISQAQVSRLEKNALDRIKRRL